MGKRLPRSQLLAEIAAERQRLVELLSGLSKRRLSERTVNASGWAAKDVVAHLVDWESRVVTWFRAGQSGQVPHLPADGFSWKDLPALNEQIYRSHRRKSATAILAEFEAVHEETLAAIRTMSDKELTQLEFYEWTGKSWALSDYLRANTASHYRWAGKKIRRWLRATPS